MLRQWLAEVVYAAGHACGPSVRLSVRPLRSGIVLYGLTYCHNFFTIQQHNHSNFTGIKHLREIPTGSPSMGRQIGMRYKNFAIFDQ